MKKNISIFVLMILVGLGILYTFSLEKKIDVNEADHLKLEARLDELTAVYEKCLDEIDTSNAYIKALEKMDQVSTDESNEIENAFLETEYDRLKNDLPSYWQDLWENIYVKEGSLSDEDIEGINFLLQPTFSYNDWFEVNPISCFFTSYYDDVKAINLTEFLRYFPKGEVPEVLPEYDVLKEHENWPFEATALFNNLPVPIHRYKADVVEEVLMGYGGIKLEDLSTSELDEIIYLESTASFYNYTSDFGPGYFKCTSGKVEDGFIKLYGDSNEKVMLVIEKIENKYSIKSFNQD